MKRFSLHVTGGNLDVQVLGFMRTLAAEKTETVTLFTPLGDITVGWGGALTLEGEQLRKAFEALGIKTGLERGRRAEVQDAVVAEATYSSSSAQGYLTPPKSSKEPTGAGSSGWVTSTKAPKASKEPHAKDANSPYYVTSTKATKDYGYVNGYEYGDGDGDGDGDGYKATTAPPKPKLADQPAGLSRSNGT